MSPLNLVSNNKWDMLWRWRHNFVGKIHFFLAKKRPLAAFLHHFSSPIESATDDKNSRKPETFSNQPQLSWNPRTFVLTPQNVQTTLQSCSSDLIALSFFMWCARQPHYFHDKPAFHHMVTVVSNLTQRYGTVKSIIEELETVGCVTKPQTLLLLMRIYWRGAMYDMVFKTFEEIFNHGYIPNTYTRNIVMDVMFRIGCVKPGLKFLEEMAAPNFLSFSIAICNLSRLGDVSNVKYVLRSMLMKGYYLNPETYSLVLNCFCKCARFTEALQLLDMMIVLGAPITVNVWSILIDSMCKSGKIEVAAYFLEKMVKSGCAPNIVTCTSLVKGFLESSMPSKAFDILRTLEYNKCFPDLVLCNVLIHCFSKMGWYEDAFEVFSSMTERKLIPDAYTFSSLVSAICLSKEYVLLPYLISGHAVQPDLVVCNCLLNYFSKAGYPEGAIDFYKDMIYRGFVPDKYSYAGLLTALCRLGRIHKAVNVYLEMIRVTPDIDAHIHTIIINVLIKSGILRKAIGLLKRAAAEKHVLDVVSYNVAIAGLVEGGKIGEAYALYSQMKQMNIAPNKHSYNLLLSGFCKNKDVSSARSVLQEMVDRNIEFDNKTCKFMRKLGLLPKEEPLLLIDKHDTGIFAGFADCNGTGYVLDPGTSSSDDVPDAAVCVGVSNIVEVTCTSFY